MNGGEMKQRRREIQVEPQRHRQDARPERGISRWTRWNSYAAIYTGLLVWLEWQPMEREYGGKKKKKEYKQEKTLPVSSMCQPFP